MPQPAQAQQDDPEAAAELEIARSRALTLGYILGGVPTSAAHARAQSQNQGSQFKPDDSQSSPPSRPATTVPSHTQFNRPNVPERSLSDPAPDNDISGTVGFSDVSI